MHNANKILLAGLIFAAVLYQGGVARAQDNATTTVRGGMYICYFYYFGNETENTELTFSAGPYVTVMDGMGYGLYFTAGGFFSGYYLVLNQPVFRAAGVHPLFDTRDLLTLLSGFATGYSIQGAGLTWTDFKNARPFTFFGYRHITD